MNPFEVSLPNYAVNIPVQYFGSLWNSGIVLRQCPEHPVHYFIGMTGSALGITFDELERLVETDDGFKTALGK